MDFPLNMLRPGSEIGIDSRLTGRDVEIESLAASIQANTLLQPLGVWMGDAEHTAGPYVAFGNRRLAALHLWRQATGAGEDALIPCTVVQGTLAQVLAMSQEENRQREALSVIDQVEGCALMANAGLDQAEIGRRIGLTQKEVAQRMALGRLHPTILAAWRADELDENDAQAFTLVADQARQLQVYQQVKAAGSIYPRQIRQAYAGGSDEHKLAKWINFVGAEAYTEAGGGFAMDLFGEDFVVLDGDLLMQLAIDKLNAVRAEVKAEGWLGVFTDLDDKNDWYSMQAIGTPAYTAEQQARLDALAAPDRAGLSLWNMQSERRTIEEAARVAGLTPEDRARSYAAIHVDYSTGAVSVMRGHALPTATAAKAAAKAEAKAAEGGEPAPVVDKLRETLTEVLASEAAVNAEATLQLVVAVLNAGGGNSPLHISTSGWISRTMPRPASFAAALDLAKRDTDLVATLAMLAAYGMDATSRARDPMASYGKGVRQEGVVAMVEHYGAAKVMDLLRERWDAAAYFGGAKASHCIAAVAECFGESIAKVQGKAKKRDLAAWCVENVPATGWLPQELRFDGYSLNPAETTQPAEVVATDAAPLPSPGAGLPPSGKWNANQKDALRAMLAAKAFDRATAMKAAGAVGLSTLGSLQTYGQADKATVKAGKAGGQHTVYWLTAAGQATAKALAAGKARKAVRK